MIKQIMFDQNMLIMEFIVEFDRTMQRGNRELCDIDLERKQVIFINIAVH